VREFEQGVRRAPFRRVVLGSGTVLDSSRLRWLIARRLNVAVQNVHAYIAGEHGNSEVPHWRIASIGSVPLREWEVPGHGRLTERDCAEIFEDVRGAAYRVIQGTGATNYAIGLAAARILEAVLHDENSVLPVSSLADGYRGL
jgi:L-lactate dehydrogenase